MFNFAPLRRAKAGPVESPFAYLARSRSAAPPASDAAAIARQIIAAGNKERGEVVHEPETISSPASKMRAPINSTEYIVAPADTLEFETPIAAPEAVARKIVEVAALAKAGGPARPKPIGLAAEIIAAGEKRRNLGKG